MVLMEPIELAFDTTVHHWPEPARDLRVALVCMPFFSADRPSIQIGLLSAIARQAGFEADPYHLNMELAARLPNFYDGLCTVRGHMTGEWLFSVAAFGNETNLDDEAFFQAFPQEVSLAGRGGLDTRTFSRLRHELLPQYIDDCLSLVNWADYQVVGFTSTFQQHVASLALARRIKERFPEIVIVFGGANLEDEMGPEYVRAFDFIDYAVVGEGDVVFPALLHALAAERPVGDMPGLIVRGQAGISFNGQAPPVRNLDGLPVPDYEEYFARAEALGLMNNSQYARMLPIESSRGCWWGQKHHCTFCGLNGLGMTYRSKSPARFLSELSTLVRRHRVTFFEATDNILDMKYVNELFTTIQESKTDYQFFYEVKANLTREQVQLLLRGGVRWIQPGVESMNSHVLQLMKKGSTMLQNVRLLKWCRYYRIRVGWNLLFGFPGEAKEDYEEELEVLKLISHLEPPNWCGRIWMERFSPYFVRRDEFPVHNMQAEASYGYVYPAHVNLDKIAYHFDYEMDETTPDEDHLATQAWVRAWQKQWEEKPDSLIYRKTMDGIYIYDNRAAQQRGSYAFYGPLALIYEFCSDTMHSIPQIANYLADTWKDERFSEEMVAAALDEFCRPGLMISEEGKYLSLAIPTNPNW